MKTHLNPWHLDAIVDYALGVMVIVALSLILTTTPISSRIIGGIQITQSTITPTTANQTSVTPSTAAPRIEIKLFTPSNLLGSVYNSGPELHIGTKVFGDRCALSALPQQNPLASSQLGTPTAIPSDGSAFTCFLTPAEFDSVADGDQVIYSHGAFRWLFGPLNKTTRRVKEQFQLVKQRGLDLLKYARPGVTDTQQQAALDVALQQLTESTALVHWRDEWHLQPSDGLAVLNMDVEAITHIQPVIAVSPLSNVGQALTLVVKDILYADDALVRIAISEAVTAGGASAELDLAQSSLSGRNENEGNGQYAMTATHYRDAWQHAMNAMKSVTPAPTLTPSPTATTTPTLDPTSPIKFQLIIPVFVGGVLNSQPLLMIGGKLFKQSRCGFEQYLTTPFRSITCIITAADLASVSDGDSVNFIYGSAWAFGPLNKNQLVMREDLRLTKQGARYGLEITRNRVTDATRLALLNAAIQTLKDTEGATYWRDIWHLEPIAGLVVFNKDIEVLTSIEDVSSEIVHVDHTLAKVALEEARSAGGTASEIAVADQEEFQGRDDEFHFRYINALTHYRNAWQHAMNAMQSVTPAPTIMPSPTVIPAVTPGQG